MTSEIITAIIAVLIAAFIILTLLPAEEITQTDCEESKGRYTETSTCLFGAERKCYEYCWPEPYFHSNAGLFRQELCECREVRYNYE